MQCVDSIVHNDWWWRNEMLGGERENGHGLFNEANTPLFYFLSGIKNQVST